jgi:hypothetical protein
MDLGEIVKEGIKHWNINNYDFNYIVKEKSDVDLSNLFNGNVKPSKYFFLSGALFIYVQSTAHQEILKTKLLKSSTLTGVV